MRYIHYDKGKEGLQKYTINSIRAISFSLCKGLKVHHAGRNKAGFTLVEFSIVIVIIGLLVGLSVHLMGPLTKRAQLTETRQIISSAREALLGYGVMKGYLPADTAADPIGMAGARSKDVWGNTLTYFADNSLEGPVGIPDKVCDATSTNFVIYVCDDDACTSYDKLENIAFVVFSRGEDRNSDGTSTGTGGSGAPCPAYAMPSCPVGMTCFYIRNEGICYEFAGGEFQYDDIVSEVSIFEIQRGRQC